MSIAFFNKSNYHPLLSYYMELPNDTETETVAEPFSFLKKAYDLSWDLTDDLDDGIDAEDFDDNFDEDFEDIPDDEFEDLGDEDEDVFEEMNTSETDCNKMLDSTPGIYDDYDDPDLDEETFDDASLNASNVPYTINGDNLP